MFLIWGYHKHVGQLRWQQFIYLYWLQKYDAIMWGFCSTKLFFAIMENTGECKEAVDQTVVAYLFLFLAWLGWSMAQRRLYHQLRSPVWLRARLRQLLSRGHIATGNVDSRPPGRHRSGSTNADREKSVLRTKLEPFFEGTNHMQHAPAHTAYLNV